MGEKVQQTIFCEKCDKEIKIQKNYLGKKDAIEKTRAKHEKKEHALITGVKFKIYPKKEELSKLNDYFNDYAKAITFAARVIDELKSPFKFCGLSISWVEDLIEKYPDKEDVKKIVIKYGYSPKQLEYALEMISNKKKEKYSYIQDKCNFCDLETEIFYLKSDGGVKICKQCYLKKFSEQGLLEKIYAAKGRRVNPSFNLFNVTKNLSRTHNNYIIKEAIQLLDALKKQRRERIVRLAKDRRRLRQFEEMLDEEKRYELPMKDRQREKRFIHINQKEKASELRGYTHRAIIGKIKILTRNIQREQKSLNKKSPINFKGSRIRLPPSVKFNKEKSEVSVTISDKISKKFEFSGLGVANKHGKRFFEEKLKQIEESKPKYSYLIRKLKPKFIALTKKRLKELVNEKDDIYDYYLQYTLEVLPEFKGRDYKGVLGIDRGINTLACLVFLEKDKKIPTSVKFFSGKGLLEFKNSRRKQLYFLKGKHNKKKKQKKIRLIEPRIDQILHRVSEQIVSLAKEKNAAIFLEDLQQPKKSRFRQKRRVKYKLSQFNFKTLSDYIEYKAKREGILVDYVPPEFTSQNCSRCAMNGDIHADTQRPYKKPNSKKPFTSLFKCNKCQVELNSDYNAAFNIAQKGLKVLNSSQS
ncbi:IS200/IS605 family element transposase accessory protein TnpB [Candidatus Pacearchaeota archaeon]|nr:IS200/IS605 family element transposase accessory protein TnpB [Candidatus Pacearchaeota archaeon]